MQSRTNVLIDEMINLGYCQSVISELLQIIRFDSIKKGEGATMREVLKVDYLVYDGICSNEGIEEKQLVTVSSCDTKTSVIYA
jgi:hypothetical protein